MKVIVFYGCLAQFNSILPSDDIPTIVDLAVDSDKRKGKLEISMPGNDNSHEKEEIPYYECVVAYSDDYAALGEHVIESFVSFIFQHDIDCFYLQNPPDSISTRLKALDSVNYSEFTQEYKTLNIPELKTIKKNYPDNILGQDSAYNKLIGTLYDVAKGRYDKPCVLLLYGSTGVGKTETAKYISEVLGEKLFRKQFSMLHSEEFTSYLFGGKHSQSSFAKELLERESNVILLDEFDKPNPIFYSAFYQLFDEGIFVDKNYTVTMKNSIIICTSNFLSEKQIRERLGDPIYSRFDAVIQFDDLPIEAIKELIKREFNKQFQMLDDDEKKVIVDSGIENRIMDYKEQLINARKIRKFVREALSGVLINHFL